ncbi:unnamed protein product [Calypogeia fissa]
MMRLWLSIVLALTAASIVSASVQVTVSGGGAQEPNGSMLYSADSVFDGGVGAKPVKYSAEYNQLFVKQTNNINSMILGPVHRVAIKTNLPHWSITWLRNWWAGTVIYFLSAGGIYFHGSWSKKDKNYRGSAIATKPALEQMGMSLLGLPVITALPTFAEYIVENGWTFCYADIAEVGMVAYFVQIAAYLAFCEFWVYWFHRWLHTPLLYKYMHHSHHFYSKLNTVSPFAGLAFNPFDGILQASPLVFALFLIPMHFQTYYILFFLEEIWTANIHDTIDGGMYGILGAGYHNFHHTHYKYNYGHLTIFMDWVYGTLIDPKTGPKRRDQSTEKVLESS